MATVGPPEPTGALMLVRDIATRWTKRLTGRNDHVAALVFLLANDGRDFAVIDSGRTLLLSEPALTWLRSEGVDV